MAKIGSLFVSLAANINPFAKSIKGAKAITQGVTRAFGQMGATLGVAFSGRAIVQGIKATMDAVDAHAKYARSVGMSVEALLELDHAAKINGLSTEKLRVGMAMMAKNVSMAAQGMGEAKTALEMLGLDAVALNEASPDKMLERIADAMMGIGNSADRARIAMQLFGESGRGLVPLLSQGGAGVRAARADRGGAITDLDAAKVEAANDAIARMTVVLDNFKMMFAVELSPALQAWAESVTFSSKNNMSAGEIIGSATATIVMAYSQVVTALFAFVEGLGQSVRFIYASLKESLGFGKMDPKIRSDMDMALRTFDDIITGKSGPLADLIALRNKQDANPLATGAMGAEPEADKAQAITFGQELSKFIDPRALQPKKVQEVESPTLLRVLGYINDGIQKQLAAQNDPRAASRFHGAGVFA
jgi:hypothetical protein